MATIGTFFKDGETLVGIITTATVQTRMVFVPDRVSGGYAAIIGGSIVGHADVRPDGTLAVQLDASVLPGLGRAVLVERNGVYTLSV